MIKLPPPEKRVVWRTRQKKDFEKTVKGAELRGQGGRAALTKAAVERSKGMFVEGCEGEGVRCRLV